MRCVKQCEAFFGGFSGTITMQSVAPNSPKLLDQLKMKLRTSHYAYRTEQAYVRWIEKFLRYHRDQNQGVWRHPDKMG